MGFRGTSVFRVAGLDGPSIGGVNARSAMIPGGAVDGLGELAAAFVNAPIARRKAKLAEDRLRAEDEDRKLRREESQQRLKILDSDLELRRQAAAARDTAATKKTEDKGKMTPVQFGHLTARLDALARRAATDEYTGFDEAKYKSVLADLVDQQSPEFKAMRSGKPAPDATGGPDLGSALAPGEEGTDVPGTPEPAGDSDLGSAIAPPANTVPEDVGVANFFKAAGPRKAPVNVPITTEDVSAPPLAAALAPAAPAAEPIPRAPASSGSGFMDAFVSDTPDETPDAPAPQAPAVDPHEVAWHVQNVHEQLHTAGPAAAKDWLLRLKRESPDVYAQVNAQIRANDASTAR